MKRKPLHRALRALAFATIFASAGGFLPSTSTVGLMSAVEWLTVFVVGLPGAMTTFFVTTSLKSCVSSSCVTRS